MRFCRRGHLGGGLAKPRLASPILAMPCLPGRTFILRAAMIFQIETQPSGSFICITGALPPD